MDGRKKYAFLRKLCDKQKGKCYYCGKPAHLPKGSGFQPMAASIEHLFPKGDIRRYLMPTKYSFVVMAHQKCNHRANDRFQEEMNKGFHYKERRYKGLLIKLLKQTIHSESTIKHNI